jgi:hypothetical protein
MMKRLAKIAMCLAMVSVAPLMAEQKPMDEVSYRCPCRDKDKDKQPAPAPTDACSNCYSACGNHGPKN